MMDGTNFLLFILSVVAILGVAAYIISRRKGLMGRNSLTVEPVSLAETYGRIVKGISFRDALHYSRSGEMVASGFKKEINDYLSQSTADGLVVGLEVVQTAQARELILAKFPEATAKMLKNESAVQVVTKNGERLLVAVDKNGRKFISQAKQVDPTVAARLAQISTLVVGAAHIIASYDNAKNIKAIDAKVDVLIEQNTNELLAELGAIFESLKEQLHSAESDEGRTHLLALKHKLKVIRSRWFLNIESELKTIKNPSDRNFLVRLFSRKKTTVQNLMNELSAQEEPLYLIRFSLQMEQVIAEVLGGPDQFNELTLPDVRSQILQLSKVISERRDWIKEHSSEDTVIELVSACERFGKSLK